MEVLSLTSERARRYAIPESCTEDLYAALRRVVLDGKAALDADATVSEHTKTELEACCCCIPELARGINVVDGDKWERCVNPLEPDKSVDVGLLVGEGGNASVLPVEGKLGIACERQGDRGGKTIHQSALMAKPDGLGALLSGRVVLCPDTLILVPRNGQEWAWYMIRRWNLAADRNGRFFSCCISDFLALIGLTSASRPCECSTAMNVFRRKRLIAEFESLGPMSQVQLPMTGICTGCRKCREACPRKAIAVILDDQGQFYPFVDKKSCKSGCRHCESVCPVLHGE